MKDLDLGNFPNPKSQIPNLIMSLEQVFFRFWRLASLPLLVIILLYCYYILPDSTAIHHNNLGKPDGFVSKETFFYVTTAVIIVFNVVISALKDAFLKLPNSAFPQENIWTKNREALNRAVEGWANLFVAVINSYLVICIIGLGKINRSEGQVLDMNYNWILLLGGVLLMLVVFYLPLKLLYSQPKVD
jgi:uncharacterized membrane protein